MTLLHFLLVIHIIVCLFLIGSVLMQQSEGGALGMGGGPSGFMTARGAGNFMTRLTWILFSVFLVLSIVLTVLAGQQRAESSVVGRGAVIEKIDPNLLRQQQQQQQQQQAPLAPIPAPAPSISGLEGLTSVPPPAPAETAPAAPKSK